MFVRTSSDRSPEHSGTGLPQALRHSPCRGMACDSQSADAISSDHTQKGFALMAQGSLRRFSLSQFQHLFSEGL